MNPLLQGLLTIIIGVGGCIGYFYLSNLILDRFIFPAKGPNIGRNINRANAVRPWLFLFPAIFALGLYLAYPVIVPRPYRNSLRACVMFQTITGSTSIMMTKATAVARPSSRNMYDIM